MVWHDGQVNGPRSLWRLPPRPGSEQQAGGLARDGAQAIRVTLMMAAVAFLCCTTALIITFVFAFTGDHALLTARRRASTGPPRWPASSCGGQSAASGTGTGEEGGGGDVEPLLILGAIQADDLCCCLTGTADEANWVRLTRQQEGE